MVEGGELDRGRARLAGRGVLELDLRVEDPVLIKLVADVEDRPQEVGLVRAVGVLVEDRLAVASDREALVDAEDAARSGGEAQAAREVLVGDGNLAELQALELLGQGVDASAELGVLPA